MHGRISSPFGRISRETGQPQVFYLMFFVITSNVRIHNIIKFSFGFLFKVLEAISLIDVRRRFIEALAPLFGRPLEADPVSIQHPCINLYSFDVK